MKVERMSVAELRKYCTENQINPKSQKRDDLVSAVKEKVLDEIISAKERRRDRSLLKAKIEEIAAQHSNKLKQRIADRKKEMELDDNKHYLIYSVLGIDENEGKQIDLYQNTGRFLYKYAGSFLEEAASLCLYFSNPNGGKHYVENSEGKKPKKFEIDFLNNNDAIELKWRDATTDGDHITKEHSRIKSIANSGYRPIRVMFYKPQRKQAIKIQEILKGHYKDVNGEYYSCEEAWSYLKRITGYDLEQMLVEISKKGTFND